VVQAEAVRECRLGGLLDHGAVHDRVGVGHAELEDVDAVLHDRHGGVHAGLQVGEADGQVADERTVPGSGPGRDGIGDAAHDCSAFSSMRSK
jgi:hypothetical protein